MEENLKYPMKWSKISKKLQGRNQHYVKNRFIWLISKENQLTREQTRKFMKQKGLSSLIEKTLEGISQKEASNSEEMSSLIEESEDERNEEKTENSLDFAIDYLQKYEKKDEGWLFLNEMM